MVERDDEFRKYMNEVVLCLESQNSEYVSINSYQENENFLYFRNCDKCSTMSKALFNID